MSRSIVAVTPGCPTQAPRWPSPIPVCRRDASVVRRSSTHAETERSAARCRADGQAEHRHQHCTPLDHGGTVGGRERGGEGVGPCQPRLVLPAVEVEGEVDPSLGFPEAHADLADLAGLADAATRVEKECEHEQQGGVGLVADERLDGGDVDHDLDALDGRDRLDDLQ